MTRHLPSFHDPARPGGLPDRSRRPMEHGTMSIAAAPEVVPLHYPLKSLALGGAADIHQISDLKKIGHLDDLTDFILGNVGHLELADMIKGALIGFLKMTKLRFNTARIPLGPETDLVLLAAAL